MRYSGEQLTELANKVDIVDLIGQTEELHKKGQNYFCCCPFHNQDDTPSLCIYPADNRWYCFGCGAGSSIYDWIMKKEDISFTDSVKKVMDITNSDIDMSEWYESESVKFLKGLKKNKDNKTRMSKLDRQVLDFTSDYLDKYSDELPKEWLAEDMTAEALRIYNIRIDNNANRIVYPVFDADGQFIGVKGRTRLAAYKELGLSKYMNYQKIGQSDYFQGWQQAMRNNPKSLIIFEGVKSCIKAYGWGITNTVAAETSNLSDGQVQLLIKHGFHEIVIAWDSDQKFKSIVTNPKIQMLKKFTIVSVIKDTQNLLGEKEAPVDRGEKIFRELLDRRIKI